MADRKPMPRNILSTFRSNGAGGLRPPTAEEDPKAHQAYQDWLKNRQYNTTRREQLNAAAAARAAAILASLARPASRKRRRSSRKYKKNTRRR
jgi:hypothetical protein